MEYRIKSHQYIDPQGVPGKMSYFIEYRVKFLFFWKRWYAVKHIDCGWGDVHRVVTYFNSLEETEKFVQDFLCTGRVHDGVETTLITVANCESKIEKL